MNIIVISFLLLLFLLFISTVLVVYYSAHLQQTNTISIKRKIRTQNATIAHLNYDNHDNIIKNVSSSKHSIKHNVHNDNYEGANVSHFLRADGIVRVLLYEGCSGSSSVYALSREILLAHDFNIKYYEYGELDDLNIKDDLYYKAKRRAIKLMFEEENANITRNPSNESILIEKIKILNEEAKSQNQVFFLKAKYTSANTISNIENSLFTGLLRKNKIDRAICVVKDCFSTIGYTIFASNKTKANLCFQRRKNSHVKLKVKFDKMRLRKFIRKDMKHDRERLIDYEKLIHPGKIQYYEDLFAFEYTSDNQIFQQSMEAWELLLKSFVDIDRDILRKKLLPLKNTRLNPPAHVNSIEHFYQVKKILKENDPPLDYFIRTLNHSKIQNEFYFKRKEQI